jgi:DNA polymerase III epsilon subunit-like protein
MFERYVQYRHILHAFILPDQSAAPNRYEIFMVEEAHWMDFIVIDVETANQNCSSICQIGIASFRDGRLDSVWSTLVNPDDEFLLFNIQLHGIGPDHIRQSPSWRDMQPLLQNLLQDKICASHNNFDRRAIEGASRRHKCTCIQPARWVDTCRIARSVWPHFTSHRLANLASQLQIEYHPHDAAEDARCAGEVLLRAADVSSQKLDGSYEQIMHMLNSHPRALRFRPSDTT